MSEPLPLGWECPKCHRAYAPHQLSCWSCAPEDEPQAFFVSPGDVNITPNQIGDLQAALNAVTEDIQWKHKIIVLPPGSNVVSERSV